MRSHPHRYVHAAALGALAVGLLVPAAASAQAPMPQTPSYGLSFVHDGGYTPSTHATMLVRGAFDESGGQTVAAIRPSPDDAAPAAVDVLAPASPGLTPTVTGRTLHMRSVTAAAAGRVLSPDRDALVVVGMQGTTPMLEFADLRPGAQLNYRSLPAEPVSVAVGRFLPGRGPVVAVSMVDGRVLFYADDDGEPTTVYSLTTPAGPLMTLDRPAANTDDLVSASPDRGRAVRHHVVAADPYDVFSTEVSAPVPTGHGSATAPAQDADYTGGRWFADRAYSSAGYSSNVYGIFATGASNTSVLGPVLEQPGKFGGAPVVGDFLGRGYRDVVGVLDGQNLRAVDLLAEGDELVAPLPSKTIGVPIDADSDGRDDLVVVSGATIDLHRNTSGGTETAPSAPEATLSPSVLDVATSIRTVTSRSFTFTPAETGSDAFECALDGGKWQDCAGPTPLSVDEDGQHELELRRRASGTTFWSDVTVLKFVVDTSRPAVPKVDVHPAGVVREAYFEVPPAPDGAVEYRVDHDDWKPVTSRVLRLGLADGAHHVTFRTRDEARDVSSEYADYAFELDTVAPKAPAPIAGPSGDTTSTTATVAVEPGSDATLECRLDGADWAACPSTITLTGLRVGEHRLDFRQLDLAGNASEATSWSWRVVADKAAAPAPSPAPAPGAAAPKPAAPNPAAETPEEAKPVVAKLSVGAPVGKGKIPVATSTGRRVAVGCAAPGATGYRCTVTVTRGGQKVGEGRRTGAGVVPVSLDKATARKVQRLGGLKVRVTLTVRTADGETTKTQKTVRILPRKVIVVPTDGLFAFDSATPSKDGVRLAKTLAAQLDGARTVTIVGHTDAKGTAAVNRRLGQERADAFRRLLRGLGVDAQVTTRSAGDTQPRASNATDGGRELNRRVEIEVRY